MPRLLLAGVIGALLALTFATPGSAATRACGLTAKIDGLRYDMREVRGTQPCSTVKRVVTQFLRDGTSLGYWTCTRGHGSSPYAASCARGKRVLVRVYAPN